MKRLAALALALAMACTLFGCGSTKSGTITEGVCYETTGISPDATVMTVDGIEVPMDMYFYNLCYAATYMESFMTSYGMEFDWDMDLGDGTNVLDAVRESALVNTKNFAVIEKLAEENNVILGEEALQQLQTQRNQLIQNLDGEENFQKELERLGLREEIYDRMCRSDHLYDALSELAETEGSSLYASDEELTAAAEEQGYMTADHILLLTKDMSTYKSLDEETIAQKKAQAEELKAKLDAYTGDDLTAYFAELADEYSEDGGRETNPEGYTFGPGEMVAEFENATAALGENEVSDIVESSYGYHIILRKPLNTEEAVSAVRAGYFDTLLSERLENANVELASEVEALDIREVYADFIAASTEEMPADGAEEEPENDGETGETK